MEEQIQKLERVALSGRSIFDLPEVPDLETLEKCVEAVVYSSLKKLSDILQDTEEKSHTIIQAVNASVNVAKYIEERKQNENKNPVKRFINDLEGVVGD